jgi:hypothetical protein
MTFETTILLASPIDDWTAEIGTLTPGVAWGRFVGTIPRLDISSNSKNFGTEGQILVRSPLITAVGHRPLASLWTLARFCKRHEKFSRRLSTVTG